MHFNAIVIALAAALAPLVVGETSGCYQIDNFGSRIHNCQQCKEGHYFIAGGGFCDIGFQCCKGQCCN